MAPKARRRRAARAAEIAIDKFVIPKGRRPLRDVADLARSIGEVGLLQPIVVDRKNRLIAGRHRLEACKALGWKAIPARVVDLDQLRRDLAELDENVERHELTVLERAEALARRKGLYELLYPETRSVTVRGGPGRGKRGTSGVRRLAFAEDAAARLRVSSKTVRRTLTMMKKLDPQAADLLRPTAVANVRQDLVRVSNLDSKTQRAVAKEISRGAKNIKTALQALRWRRVPGKGSTPKKGEHYELIVGDFAVEARKLAPESVDLVIADPPWSRSWVPRLAEMIEVTARVLRPGGRTLVFIGQEFLPQLFAVSTDQLTYKWTLCLRSPKAKANWNGGVLSAWLPIVVLQKPGDQPRAFRWDVLEDDAPAKKTDPWAKSERVLGELISWFSRPGDTVLDLFCGSGSAGVAAVVHGRRFCGIDIDPQALDVAAPAIANVRWATSASAATGRRAYPV